MKELGKIIQLPKITDPRGNLTVAEELTNVPFDIRRAYWVYDVPGGESRGGHAHKRLRQLIVALSGISAISDVFLLWGRHFNIESLILQTANEQNYGKFKSEGDRQKITGGQETHWPEAD